MDEKSRGNPKLFSSSLVGDGGASWRLKAMKRAQEQAGREGRKLNEVVEERWGSLGDLTVSLASRKAAAPTHAHLHAIKSRRSSWMQQKEEEDTSLEKSIDKAKMRVPKVPESLSWGKRRLSCIEDTSVVYAAMSSMNNFSNDGSFMRDFMRRKMDDDYRGLSDSSNTKVKKGMELETSNEDSARMKPPSLSANRLAAKVLQVLMKGKHEEVLKEVGNTKGKPDADAGDDESYRPRIDGSTSRCIMHDISARRNSKEDDGDLHLAQSITQNQKYGADDEYDYYDGEPRKKGRKKQGKNDSKSSELTTHANRFLMQQDRCQFCFENPKRPKHLVVAIANFSYLSLPNWEPVVPGHCCILTTQHEPATRSVDNNVWDEIRNFKKCLIMMFGQQEKDVVFLETVMGLSQQRRHCLVECIPLPQEVAGLAPVYFKKAIDEAEEEWSQHNAKKLIDTTSEKGGLRASIPKNFPYFHVEFGLKKGFVHVIDDETQFKSNFGVNVIRGMLRLPGEDRRKHESVDVQKLAVAKFVKDWEPFYWTKQLEG